MTIEMSAKKKFLSPFRLPLRHHPIVRLALPRRWRPHRLLSYPHHPVEDRQELAAEERQQKEDRHRCLELSARVVFCFVFN
jgi:hypothetical protein